MCFYTTKTKWEVSKIMEKLIQEMARKLDLRMRDRGVFPDCWILDAIERALTTAYTTGRLQGIHDALQGELKRANDREKQSTQK